MLKGVPGQWKLFAPAGHLAPVAHHIPVKLRGFKRSWQIASAADPESPVRCCGCPTDADGRPSAAASPRPPSRRRILAHASVDGFSKQVGMSGVAAVLFDQVA